MRQREPSDDTILCCNPNVTYTESSSGITFFNHFDGISYETDEKSIAIFERFRKPMAISALPELTDEVRAFVSELFSRTMLVDELGMIHLVRGYLVQEMNTIGQPAPYYDRAHWVGAKYCIVSAAFDLGSKIGGAAVGPQEIRVAFQKYQRAIELGMASCEQYTLCDFEQSLLYDAKSLRTYDLGSINHDPADGVASYFFKLEKIVSDVSSKNAVPIVLGGDHTITLPCASACARKHGGIGLLVLDAHHDLYSNTFAQRNTTNHGNYLLRLLENKDILDVCLIGVRTFEYLSNFTKKK